MTDLSLALRNLWRHRIRSLIVLCGVLFAVVALMLSGGFIEWVFFAMREAAIESRLGHIQVFKSGYLTSAAADPNKFLLPEKSPALDTIQTTPEVRIVSQRLALAGLVSHGETSVSFLGEGVEPEKEAAIGRQLYITHGSNLSSADPKGVILGEGLAATLAIQPGDKVVLLATTASGSINAVECNVRGIFYTSSKTYDDVTLRVPIGTARELLRVSGAHLWVIMLNRTEDTDHVMARFKRQFEEATSKISFKSWRELDDFYNKTVVLFSRQFNVVNVIIGIIIVLSISNSLIASVLERTGEIGTLMALGIKRRRILQLFLTEGILLGTLGGVAGLIVGYGLAQLISFVGIPMPPPPGMQRGFTGQIRLTWQLAAGSFLLSMVTSLVASLYPAWKASCLVIVDALRQNR